MPLDLKMQRLYDRAELVVGIGDPQLNRFCVMSFVAFMAGEWFGDRPKTASPVIRKFVIPLNDRVDAATRQRLKPFAVRIIGTNDGYDAARADMIYHTVVSRILPAALRDLAGPSHAADGPQAGESAEDAGDAAPAAIRLAVAALPLRLRRNVDHILDARAGGRLDLLAKEASHLTASAAEMVSGTERRDWYLTMALDLLDRLCDVGAGQAAREISPAVAADSAGERSQIPA